MAFYKDEGLIFVHYSTQQGAERKEMLLTIFLQVFLFRVYSSKTLT